MDDPYFRERRQGHVVAPGATAGLAGLYVIVSQDCDVVQPKRELVQLAPLITLEDEETRRGALKRVNARYPPVGAQDPPLFADLAAIVSVAKSELIGAPVDDSLAPASEIAAREFGLAVGRWFGRFAFPDEIQPWLAPAEKLIREKYDSPDSALGRVLQDVVEVRVEADSWTALPARLTLHVVVATEALPVLAEDAEAPSVTQLPADLTALCQAILDESEPSRLSVLWSAFADALAARCKPKGAAARDERVASAVLGVTGEVSTEDEFPLSKVRRSEQLDVEYLSDPRPF